MGVAVEVVEEQPVADQHGRHDGEHAGPAREVGEDARVEEVSPHRQGHRRAGEMPAPAQQGAQKEAGSAGEEGLQEARSAGGGVCLPKAGVCRAQGRTPGHGARAPEHVIDAVLGLELAGEVVVDLVRVRVGVGVRVRARLRLRLRLRLRQP